MKRSFSLFAITFALALAATTQSQADPFQYSYNWSASPDFFAGSAGAGFVSFTDNDGGAITAETDTVAAKVSVFSLAWSDNPDLIGIPSSGSNYTLVLSISDGIAKDAAGTISFTGLIQGHLTHDSFNLTNIITGVTDYTGARPGQTSGITTVGNMRFSVSYKDFAVPGPEAKPSQGAISFEIGSEPDVGGGPTAPEPSSMVLGCLGLTFLGGVIYRTRRRKDDLLSGVV